MPPNRHRGGGPVDLTDADISFPLARLFDPFNLDHVPERKRMEHFEQRDLAHIKHYKAAVKIFGGPLSRKRVLIAPPMETPLKHRLGLYSDKKEPPAPPVLNTKLDPQIPAEKPPPEELVIAREAREREDKYKEWFKERQKFRNDLEGMGLNMDYLSKKPNKTLLEKRVFRQLKEEAGKAVAAEEEEVIETPDSSLKKHSSDSESSDLPHLKIPAPLGLKILDQHLKEQKLRLIDLFTSADKNKDWTISREEFIKSCEERNIPISRGLLEDMLITLDMNLDEVLDYKEMAQGMEQARREKREDRRKELSRESTIVSEKSAHSAGSSSKIVQEMLLRKEQEEEAHIVTPVQKAPSPKSQGKSANTSMSSKTKKSSDKSSEKSAVGKNTTSTATSPSKGTVKSEGASAAGGAPRSDHTASPFLEPPPPDTRLEQMILSTDEEMVDLRKRDREGLKGYNAKLTETPGTIKTGNKAIDDHSMTCTMKGETGDMINDFRSKRLQEYYAVVKMCRKNDIPLTQNLLERVLLYPPERPRSQLQKIRPPDSAPLVSAHFADPPKRPRTPIEVKHKDKVRRSKSGKLLIDSRHKYPSNKTVAPEPSKQNLSTGRAVIRRRVDCWMTFEEYERLTRNMAIRYQHLHGNTQENVFWPGHLLDKLRLCMPPYNKPPVRDNEVSLYRRVHRTPAVNYGFEASDTWPINESNYIQVGIHDHFKNKTII